MLMSKQAKAEYCYGENGYCNAGVDSISCFSYDNSQNITMGYQGIVTQEIVVQVFIDHGFSCSD